MKFTRPILGALAAFALVFASASAANATSNWIPVVNQTTSGTAYGGQQIATNSSGLTVSAWAYNDGQDNYTIQVSSSSDGVNWSTPVDINDPADAQSVSDPVISVNGDGWVIAWVADSGAGTYIQANSSTDGLTWNVGDVADLSTTADVSLPTVATSDSGTFAVMWETNDFSAGLGIETATFDFTNDWGATATLYSPPSWRYEATPNGLAVDASGNVIASWDVYYTGSAADRQYIQASMFNGTSWSTPSSLSTVANNIFGSQSQVAIDSAGDAVIAWDERNDTSGVQDIKYVTFGGTSWSTAAFASDPSTGNGSFPGQDAYYPQLTVNSNDVFALTWTMDDGSSQWVQVATSTDSGSTWSTNDMSDSSVAVTPWYEEIFTDANGGMLAVWGALDSGNFLIAQSSYSSDDGATWSTPSDLSAAGYSADELRAAADPSGAWVVSWYQQNSASGGSPMSGTAEVVGSVSTDGTTWSPTTLSTSAMANSAVAVTGSSAALTSIWLSDTDTMQLSSYVTWFDVAFDSQQGSSVSSVGFPSGGSMTLPAAPTLSGSTFNGWYDAATGGTLAGQPGDSYSPGVSSNVTLYAQWTLAPSPSPSPTDTSTASPSDSGASNLASSGATVAPVLAAAGLLALLGVAFALIAKRRRNAS